MESYKKILAIGMVLVTLPAFAGVEAENYYVVNRHALSQPPSAEESRDVVAELPAAATLGEGEFMGLGYSSFKLANSVSPTKLLAADGRDPLLAGDLVGNDVIGYTFTADSKGAAKLKDFVRYDRANKTFEKLASMDGTTMSVLDMAYDKLGQKMYALTIVSNASMPSLSEVNMTDGSLRLLTTFDKRFYSMAADGAGNLFMVERNNGKLWVISAGSTDYLPIRVGGNGPGAVMISSMAFDKNVNKLYWARTGMNSTGDATECRIVEINPLNGTQNDLNTISRGSKSTELLAFVIPEATYADGVPGQATNFTVTPQPNGTTAADLSWTNPTGNLEKMLVYVDNNLKQTLTDVAAGAPMTLSLKGVAHGYHYFRLVGVNSVGEGRPADFFVWVGTDVPTAPINLKLERDIDGKAQLSWEKPTTSIHGAFLPETIKYKITRRSAEGTDTTLVKVYRDVTYTDVVEKGMVYSYTVQALSNSFGDASTTPDKYIGAAMDVPYIATLDDPEELNYLEMEDCNGDRMSWGYYLSAGKGNLTLLSYAGSKTDDKLSLPPLKLKGGKKYLLSFTVNTGRGIYDQRKLNVTMRNTAGGAIDSLFNETLMTDTMEIRHKPIMVAADGEYVITFHDYSDATGAMLSLDNLMVREDNFATIYGRVTDKQGKPIEGVTIDLSKPYFRQITDKDGKYEIKYIPGEEMKLTAAKYHYEPQTTDAFTLGQLERREMNIMLDRTPHFKVEGTIVDPTGAKVPGVEVSIRCNGEITRVKSDSEGKFLFGEVINLMHGIEFMKPKFQYARGSLDVKRDTMLTILLHPTELVPEAPEATIDASDKVTVKWNDPNEYFRRDCGVQEKQTGTAGGNQYSIAGTVWRVPTRVKSITWMTSAYAGPHNKMNLWLFDIDSLGQPTTTPLYSVMDVPSNGDLKWTTFELPEPVDCPNGFLVGVSFTRGMSSLAMDTGMDEDWPFHDGVNFTNVDFRSKGWNCCDKFYLYRNFMIRAEGEVLDPNYVPYGYKYKVWRLKDGQTVADKKDWKLLTSTSGDASHEVVDDLSKEPAGSWRYALSTVYPDGIETDEVFSDKVTSGGSGIGSVEADGYEISVMGRELTVKTSESSLIEVFDTEGRCVATAKGMLRKHFETPGMYIVCFTAQGEKITKKIYLY